MIRKCILALSLPLLGGCADASAQSVFYPPSVVSHSPFYPAPTATVTSGPPVGFLLRYVATNIDGSNNSTLTDLDAVGTWVNLGSRSSANATQATTSAKPTYRNSGGVEWLDFDGGDYLQTGTFTTISQDFTFVAVAGYATGTSFGANPRIYDGTTSSPRVSVISEASAAQSTFAGVSLTSSNTVSVDEYNSYVSHYNGSSSSFVLNGTEVTGNAGTNTMVDLTIGARFSGTFNLLGRFREIIVYPGDYTSDAALGTYLTDTYGSLPVSF